jgi:hypothetical protein
VAYQAPHQVAIEGILERKRLTRWDTSFEMAMSMHSQLSAWVALLLSNAAELLYSLLEAPFSLKFIWKRSLSWQVSKVSAVHLMAAANKIPLAPCFLRLSRNVSAIEERASTQV